MAGLRSRRPDIYLLVCERLGVAADCLRRSRTRPPVAAAKAAGLTCIAVPQFAETDVSAADRVIDSLEDCCRSLTKTERPRLLRAM